MEDTINYHNIVWDHTLEMAKWTPLLGKTLDEGLRNYLNPFLPKDIDHEITYYNPFEIDEYKTYTYDNDNDVELDLDNYDREHQDDNDISSSDDEDNEYFEFD
jgi:hypothetical protein